MTVLVSVLDDGVGIIGVVSVVHDHVGICS